VTSAVPLSFDLVVATVGRTEQVSTLLDSVAAQAGVRVRVLLVDQNGDDRLASVVAAHDGLEVERVTAPRGLSRARNEGLARLTADVVGFPDDDCRYPPELLAAVAGRLLAEPELDGVCGRLVDDDGRASPRWPAGRVRLDRGTVWHGGSSATMFLRRTLVRRVGEFDTRLGLGAGTPWCAGEETDYLVRALDAGAALDFDPALEVRHALRPTDAASRAAEARCSGGAVGFILRKHRFPRRTVARMLIRPLGGAAAAALHGDLAGARFQARVLRWRAAGYAAGGRAPRPTSSSNSSA
jgi:hypothetical protein